MKAVYKLSDFEFIKKVSPLAGGLAFILTNQKGGFLYQWPTPQTRYEGWFLTTNLNGKERLLKILDRLIVNDIPEEIENNFYQIKRKHKLLTETFFIEDDILFWQADKIVPIELIFDPREIFKNPEWGRSFSFEELSDTLVIKYIQENDFGIYAAVYPKPQKFVFKNIWQKTDYPLDRKRNSPPFSKHVNNTLEIKTNSFVISAGPNKNEAIASAKAFWHQRDQALNKARKDAEELIKLVPKSLKSEDFLAYFSGLGQIKSLIQQNKATWAGLPWFCQPWARDTAMALPAIAKIDLALAKKLIFSLLESIRNNGFLPATLNNYSPLISSDAVYFLFKAVEELLKLRVFKDLEIEHIKNELEKTIKSVENHHLNNGLVNSLGELSTWMDTIPRSGQRIELQAGQLMLYKLAEKLGLKNYSQKYQMLKLKIKQTFFDNEKIFDGVGDKTQRPNIFLAYWLCPDFLEKSLWEKTINFSLLRLWLDWGGLATVDINDSRFKKEYTGEDNQSYHNGDSWFWLNNLAAWTMADLDKGYYSNKIKKILEASKTNLLWLGAIGQASELSSAKELRAEGAISQLWSAASLIYLIDKINL